MIGLSVSNCVRDILNGNVKVEEVQKIIGRTEIENESDLRKVVKDYSKIYWDNDPDLGETIFRQLFEARKIEQPRLKGDMIPDIKDRPH